MKSNVIKVNTLGKGFAEAKQEAQKAAVYENLKPAQALRLQLITEEMLSLISSVTHETEFAFWVETEMPVFHLYISADTIMDAEKRAELLSTSSSGKNAAAKTFLGHLRDLFEQAMTAEPNHSLDIPDDLLNDLPNHPIADQEWDGMERSVLRSLVDDVQINIVGRSVEMKVVKRFD